MYKKVHSRLTLLCAGITAAIMVVMSLIYLYVSEKGLYRNQYYSFRNDINTISTNLEQQYIISMEWLAKMEAQGHYIFFVLDNGIPFLYNQLTGLSDGSSRQGLLQESLNAYNDMFDVSSSGQEGSSSLYTTYHFEYEFTSPSTGDIYFSSVINMERDTSQLQVIVLYPLDLLEKQIWEQRLRFFIIDIITILILAAFSWIFTGKLLKPIWENQKKQAEFVASASHELRTPLAVILSSAECCTDASPERRGRFITTIKQEGLRMSALIEDMLNLSSSDSSQFKMEMENVELDTLLINSYETFEALAREKTITLSIEIPKNSIPLAYCDPDRIRQVISILLHNAICYTPPGGTVKMLLSHTKKGFYVSIADNGIGISNEDKKRVFDRFYRAERSRSTKGHFGLGLSIAYEIVKKHNGDIGVKDADGGGSLFYFTLP